MTMLAAGTLITILAAGLTLVTETAGGLGAVLGCVLVAIAVALGYPSSSRAGP